MPRPHGEFRLRQARSKECPLPFRARHASPRRALKARPSKSSRQETCALPLAQYPHRPNAWPLHRHPMSRTSREAANRAATHAALRAPAQSSNHTQASVHEIHQRRSIPHRQAQDQPINAVSASLPSQSQDASAAKFSAPIELDSRPSRPHFRRACWR